MSKIAKATSSECSFTEIEPYNFDLEIETTSTKLREALDDVKTLRLALRDVIAKKRAHALECVEKAKQYLASVDLQEKELGGILSPDIMEPVKSEDAESAENLRSPHKAATASLFDEGKDVEGAKTMAEVTNATHSSNAQDTSPITLVSQLNSLLDGGNSGEKSASIVEDLNTIEKMDLIALDDRTKHHRDEIRRIEEELERRYAVTAAPGKKKKGGKKKK